VFIGLCLFGLICCIGLLPMLFSYVCVCDFKKSFLKGKTWRCKSIAKRICEQKLESSLIKSFSEKLINSFYFVVDARSCAQLDHVVIVQFSGVARSRYLNMRLYIYMGGKHWFWVKLALITFVSTSTTAVDNWTICTNRLLFLCVEFCPFWVSLCKG